MSSSAPFHWGDYEHLRWTGFHAGAAVARLPAAIYFDAISPGLSIARLPTKSALPAFQADCVLLTNRPTYAASIKQVRVDQAFIISNSVADGAEWAIAST